MRHLIVALAALLITMLQSPSASAAMCSKDDFAKAVDRAGAALRKVSADSMPRINAKLLSLKEKRARSKPGFEQGPDAALHDDRIAQFDAQSNDLLTRVDEFGSFTPATEADCARLDDLNATTLELLATVKAKAAYTLAKLDQMLAEAPTQRAANAGPVTAPVRQDQNPPTAPLNAKPPSVAKADEKKSPAPRVPSNTSGSTWVTENRSEPPLQGKNDATAPPLPVRPFPERSASVQRPIDTRSPTPVAPAEDGYTIDDIKAASAGLFGKVSANVAAVIEHVFAKSGRPRAYIIGEETGGAFIAGVRYGSGTLYLREGGTQKIYWHGPSVGTDLGGDGSKTLFLIYRLRSINQLYSNFTGIAGSAYLVGGAGATFTTNGDLILAPIRSGIGLRFGANIGYIRFTPKKTWNPF